MKPMIVAALVVLLSGHQSARADILHLENGEKLEGAVELEGDSYRIVLADGETQVLSKAEVKRWQYVSPVTPSQALEMLQELQRLVVPVFTQDEPEQFRWLADVRRSTSEYEYHRDGERFTVSRRTGFDSGGFNIENGATGSVGSERGGGSSSSESRWTKERELTIDDIFADEWVRYIASFEMLADDPRYVGLVARKRRTVCLGDFANYAADEYKDVRLSVRAALDALDAAFEQGQKSKSTIQGVIRSRIELQDDILEAKRAIEKAKDRLERANAKAKDSAKRKLHAAEDRQRELERKQTKDSTILELAARRNMQDFAKQQALALNGVQRTIELLRGDFEQVAAE